MIIHIITMVKIYLKSITNTFSFLQKTRCSKITLKQEKIQNKHKSALNETKKGKDELRKCKSEIYDIETLFKAAEKLSIRFMIMLQCYLMLNIK